MVLKNTSFIQIGIVYTLKKKHWDALDKTILVADGLCQSKNDYKNAGRYSGYL